MKSEPKITVHIGGDGFPTRAVEIEHRGAKLLVRFQEGDVAGEQLPLSFEIHPDVEPLEPRVLRRFAPQAELYTALARSALRMIPFSDPVGEFGSPEERQQALTEA